MKKSKSSVEKKDLTMCLLGLHKKQPDSFRCGRCNKSLLDFDFEKLLERGSASTYTGLAQSTYNNRVSGDTLTVTNLREAIKNIEVGDNLLMKAFRKHENSSIVKRKPKVEES